MGKILIQALSLAWISIKENTELGHMPSQYRPDMITTLIDYPPANITE